MDTVRASLVGSEDNSEHVAAYLRAVRRIHAHVPLAAVLLTHHAGWQDGDGARKRERGSSAWRGNCDATFYLEAGDADADGGETVLTLRALKVRDAERPAPLHMIRRRVELTEALGDDVRRGPVTSCVIAPDRRTREDREADRVATVGAEQVALDLRLLQAVADRPDLATNQDGIRVLLNVRKTVVAEAVARLVRKGWLLPGRRGHAYTVTPGGRGALGGEADACA